MGRARNRRERVLEHLTELRDLSLGGTPEPAFRERLRARLVSGALDAEEPQATPHRPAHQGHRPAHRRPARRHRPVLSQLATLGLAAAMMVSAFATYQSVPGDTLYPLKRAAESTLVRLSSDDAERGERELDSAQSRAREIASLLGSSVDGPLLSETLEDMEESTRAGISKLERAEPRSPKIKDFAQDQKEAVRPMLKQLDNSQLAQAEGYLDYIEGLAVPD
ncbi:hypothetical protein FH608_036275 [Nonomuraea phyllanthi]|uniref:DUF5667 domain-containing protein n=1 Tax=Nonomuraea phyllanthi TaxID=2219224 RepID=A0A5C4VW52_9ACTN|nr:DUF5667 domain-containing protein [Nonomuraea phyllanthi]KAB8190409.1 hypothetical protein FH608_036275 [Nonomuraea phyllanthi]QFY05669.1 hypothetical protein GBF35_02335 [Nonomuraea phyllanthi]